MNLHNMQSFLARDSI